MSWCLASNTAWGLKPWGTAWHPPVFLLWGNKWQKEEPNATALWVEPTVQQVLRAPLRSPGVLLNLPRFTASACSPQMSAWAFRHLWAICRVNDCKVTARYSWLHLRRYLGLSMWQQHWDTMWKSHSCSHLSQCKNTVCSYASTCMLLGKAPHVASGQNQSTLTGPPC